MSAWVFNEDYLHKLEEGDSEIEKHFITYFEALLQVKLRNKVKSPQLIEDISQETFLRVLKSLRKGGIRNPDRLGAFVNAVCNNVMMESLRASTRYRQMPDDLPEIVDEAADPFASLETEQRRRLFSEILESLPEFDREVLRRIYLEELSMQEVSRQMGVSHEYLRGLIHGAKIRFGLALEQTEGSRPQRRTREPQDPTSVLERYARWKTEVDVFADRQTLFLLSFIETLVLPSAAQACELVGWPRQEFDRVLRKLLQARMLTVWEGQLVKFKVSARGKDLLSTLTSTSRNAEGLSILHEERLRVIREILAELPPKDREILRQIYLEHADKPLTIREMGVTPDYVGILLNRANARIRAALDRKTR